MNGRSPARLVAGGFPHSNDIIERLHEFCSSGQQISENRWVAPFIFGGTPIIGIRLRLR
jgi:hypothetical protein